jgi:hypothetical protein
MRTVFGFALLLVLLLGVSVLVAAQQLVRWFPLRLLVPALMIAAVLALSFASSPAQVAAKCHPAGYAYHGDCK